MAIVDTTVSVDYLKGASTPEVEWLDRETSRQRLGLLDLMALRNPPGALDRERGRVLRHPRRFEVFQTGGIDFAITGARNYRHLRSRGRTDPPLGTGGRSVGEIELRGASETKPRHSPLTRVLHSGTVGPRTALDTESRSAARYTPAEHLSGPSGQSRRKPGSDLLRTDAPRKPVVLQQPGGVV